MFSKKGRDKNGSKAGSQNQNSSQTYHTEIEEKFPSVYDSKKCKTSQKFDNTPRVHDSSTGTRDRQNSTGKQEEERKIKSSPQRREHNHSDQSRSRSANYDYDNHSPEKCVKTKEHKTQGAQNKMHTCPRSHRYHGNSHDQACGRSRTLSGDPSMEYSCDQQRGRGKTSPATSSMEYSPCQQKRRGSISPVDTTVDHSDDRQRERGKTSPAATAMDYSPGSSGKASHKGKCVKFGKISTYHCATCQQWVCNSCKEMDHPTEECVLIEKKFALQEMKDAHVIEAKDAVEGVRSALVKLHSYNDNLNAFISTMKATNEYIAEEKKIVEMMIENGKDRKREIQTTLTEMEQNTCLPDAIAALQQISKISKSINWWTSRVESKNCFDDSMAKAFKEISLCTLQMMMNEAHENQTDMMILAVHNISNQIFHSLITLKERSLFIPCLDKKETVPFKSRTISLLSFKAIMDPSSALAYLDIGNEGEFFGRVVIQVMSGTTRGRQFLMMCTGEAGPSYRNTNFHRIWWKNRPGENIWGGDYEEGDGSGGKSVLNLTEREISSLPAGKRMPIKAGLVAGSFENKNTVPSTIFRIYTKSDSKPRGGSRSTDIKVAYEDSAFGEVVQGLEVLTRATQIYPVTEIIIVSCGIIIDL